VRAFVLLLPILVGGCAWLPPDSVHRPIGASLQARKAIGSANILTVGFGKAYALPSDAVQAAMPDDIIQIFPGKYVDCSTWKADGLVIEGVGAGAIIADKVCGDKGLFIVKGRNITVRNITFMSARASSHNGSGIRAEGANLTVENSRFIDNEDGILAGDNFDSTITIKDSYFKGNGNCIAACAHGIYINHVALLRVEHSEFFEQHEGHHIKSRAARTEIIDNSIHDGPNGSTSYLVDLPNGGSALIFGNDFEKGPASQNKQTAIAIGAEKNKVPNPSGPIVIENNTFSNDTGTGTTFVRNYTKTAVSLQANRFAGDVTPLSGPMTDDEIKDRER
jgi:hypothetical protein